MTDETPRYDLPVRVYDVFVGRVGRFDVWHDPNDPGTLPWRIAWGLHNSHCWLGPRLIPAASGDRTAHITPHEWCLIHQRVAEYANQKDYCND